MISRAHRGAVLAALVALTLLASLLVALPARAELVQPRQQWLRDSTAGLFLHWGMRTAPGYFDCRQWEAAVTNGGWDPDYWVEEGRKLHVQYLVLASFHSRLGYARAWPSAIPGSCSTERDFLGELITAANAKGLKVILYMTDDPQWYWEGWQPTRPPDPTDPADIAKPSWLDSAAYSAYKHKDVNLHVRPGFGEFSYDNFVEVMNNYPDLAGFWIDNDNAYWEENGLYERIRVQRPTWTLSNNNEDTPIMDMVSHEQKTGMTPPYDYPQAVLTPMPRLTEGQWKLPTKGAWWYDGTDADVDYPVTLGRIITNAGSSIKSLMAETAMVNGRFPPKQEAFNNFAATYLDGLWGAIHGTEGGGYMYGGLVPGFWNGGAHGVTTVSKTNPDLHYVHVLTKPASDSFIRLRDNGYRVTRVRNFRTGATMDFTQANGFLTIEGISAWDQYDTVFTVDTAGRTGAYLPHQISATASVSQDGFPARHLTDGDYLTYWDNDTTVPVSLTLDLGSRRDIAYLAINQREWSPTYNRETFGRVEDSARIKDYQVHVSDDGKRWTTAVANATMPSVRGTQYVDLNLQHPARYVRLDVQSTWAAATVPRFYKELQIDEMWVGSGYPTAANPDSATTIEAESGTVGGHTRVAPCVTCSGGAKVENIGNDTGNDLTMTVNSPRGGDRTMTVVGSVAGTGTYYVSINGGPATPVTLTGSSFTSPLLARPLPVHLRAGANTIRVFNPTSYAPDIDRITIT